MPAVPVARYREGCTPGVEGAVSNRIRTFLNPRCLTTELPAPEVGLGGPSGFEHDVSRDLLHVSLNGIGWDNYTFQPLTTPLPVNPFPPAGNCPLLRKSHRTHCVRSELLSTTSEPCRTCCGAFGPDRMAIHRLHRTRLQQQRAVT